MCVDDSECPDGCCLKADRSDSYSCASMGSCNFKRYGWIAVPIWFVVIIGLLIFCRVRECRKKKAEDEIYNGTNQANPNG